MKNDTNTAAGKTYYGVKEVVFPDHETLVMITGVYPEKPEDTEEYNTYADVCTNWYDTEAEAQRYYTERRRELFPEEFESDEDEDEEYDWDDHYRSLQADADVTHAIEHGYIDSVIW